MRTEIRRVCHEAGLTAVYVTHDQKEALSIADRMAVLEGGHIRQLGTPAELYRRPRSRFVADFMGETNFLNGRVAAVTGGEGRIETSLGIFSAAGMPVKVKSGDDVVLSIRPESWKLGTERPAENAVAGRLRERLYLGEMAQYRMAPAAAAATELKIFELNPRFVDASEDRELFATVLPDDVVVLEA
jgi:iron(III) transport system ATP-binding protein